MTTSHDTTVGSVLLYLAIDLGPQPTMGSFGRQVDAINTLWWHNNQLVGHMIVGGLPPQRSDRPSFGREMGYFVVTDPPPDWEATSADRLLVARTKLASPWVSVLTTVAEKSAPIGYGITALWGLQRLLAMVMDWQRHRLELELGRMELNRPHNPTAQELVVNHASSELAVHADESGQSTVDMIAVEGKMVTNAVRNMRTVLDARIVDEDDPVTNI